MEIKTNKQKQTNKQTNGTYLNLKVFASKGNHKQNGDKHQNWKIILQMKELISKIYNQLMQLKIYFQNFKWWKI